MDAATEVAAFFLPQEIDYFSKQQKGGWWLSIVISWLMFLSPKADLKESLRDIAFDLPGRFPIARWAPIPLRLIVGFGFMEHGFAKLSKGPDAFADILHELAVPAPHFMAWVSILTELLGGLAILLGAFVSLVSLPMAV